MANTQGDIRFRVGLETDQQSFNKLRQSLQSLQKIRLADFGGSLRELSKVQETAREVETALVKAFNPQLGSINIQTFNQSLGLTTQKVNQIYANFSKAGSQGKAAFSQMATSVLTTNLQLKETRSLIDEMGTTMMNTVKWGIASSVMNTFTGSVRQAFQYVKSLQGSLTDIRIVTGDSTDQMQRFAQSANKAAQELGRSTLDYTKSSLTFYQQGLDDETVQARTEAVLKAQNITGAGSQMANYLTSVWNGYKVANEEAELYVDKLAAVADSSASNMSQLAIAMSKVASTANIMGVDVDQLTAQIATVVATTRQAPESVGTAFKTIYARLNDIKAGSDEAEISLGNYSSKMASLGINVLDATGKLRDTGQVMEEIGSKWATMTREQQMYLAATMGGQRQITQVTALFDNWGKYTDLLNISLDSQGTLVEKNSRYMDSLGAKMEQLGSAGERVKASLINTDDIKGLIGALTQVVNLVGNFTESFGGGTNVLLALGSVATQVFSGTISKEINNVITNWQNAKNNLAIKAEDINQTQLWGQSQGLQQGAIQEIIEAKKQIHQYYNTISDGQANAYNKIVENIGLRKSQVLVLEDTKNILQHIWETNGEEQFTEELQNLRQGIGETRDQLRNLSFNDIINNSQGLNDVKQRFVDLQESIGKGSLSALDSFVDNFDELVTKVQKGEMQIANFKQTARGLLSNVDNSLSQDIDEVRDKTNEASAALQMATKQKDEFLTNISQQTAVRGFVNLTGAIGQTASALRSLSNIPSIWSNENLSGGEKFLQTLMAISYSMPSLILNYQKIRKATLSVSQAFINQEAITKAKIELNEIEKKLNQQKILQTKIEQAQTQKKIAQQKLHSAQIIKKIGLRRLELDLQKGKITQDEYEAAAGELNNLVETKNNALKTISITLQDLLTKKKSLGVVATQALTAAQAKLNTVLNWNPLMPWIVALGAVVGIIYGAVKAYDYFTMSVKQAEEAIDTFNQKQEQSANKIKQYSKTQTDLENAKKEWQELARKAGAYNSTIDKLTDEEKQRYYELSNLIAQYNSSAVAGYDEQGNAIIKNNKALQQTIDLLKDAKQQQIDETYGGEEFQSQQKANKVLREDANSNLDETASNVYSRLSSGQFNAMASQKMTDQQKEKLEQIKQYALEIRQGNYQNAETFASELNKFYKDLEKQGIELTDYYKKLGKDASESVSNYLKYSQINTSDVIGLLSTSDNNEKYEKAKSLGIENIDALVHGYIDGMNAVDAEDAVNQLNAEGGILDLFTNAFNGNEIAKAAEKFNEDNTSFTSIKDKQNKFRNELFKTLNSGNNELKALFAQAAKDENLAKLLEDYFAQLYGLEDLDLTFSEDGLVSSINSIDSSIQDGLTSLKDRIGRVAKAWQGENAVDVEMVLNPDLTESQIDAITVAFDKWIVKTHDVEIALKKAQEEVLNLKDASQDIGGYNSAFKLNAGESLSDEEMEAFSSQMEGLKQSYPQLANAVDILTNKQLEGTEIYGHALDLVRDKLIANAVEMKQLGYSEEILDQQSLSLIHSLNDLKDLQGAMSDKAIADGLEKLAAQYANCSDEVSIFKSALLTNNEATIEAAKNNLQLAIRSGELGQQYGFQADQIEALARIRAQGNKELQNNANAATEAAKAELRASRALQDLDKNLDKYADILKKIGKGQQGDVIAEDWETYDGLKDTLADLLDVNKELVGDDWIADNWETIQEAIKGNEEAINELDSSVSNNLFNDLENLLTTDALDYLNGDLDSLAERLNNLPQGELSIDDTAFLNVLANAMAQAGMSAQQIEDAFASKNIYLNVEPATESLDALLQSAGYTGQGLVENLATDIQTTTTTDKAQDRVEAAGVRYERGGTLQTDVSIPTITTENGMPSSFGPSRISHAYWQGVRAVMTPAVDTLNKQTTSTAVQVSNPYKGKKAGGNISNKTKPGTNKKSGGGGKGKKGGGGSSKKTNTTAAVKSTFDRYHDINKAIDKTTKDLTKQQQKQAKLNGKDLIDNLNEQSKILKEQVELYKQKQAIQEDERKELQDSIKTDYKELTKILGDIPEISFLDNGDISDYAAFMNNLTDAMNAKIKWYDANQEGRKEEYEKYKESYEKILEDFERYEELIDEEMPDLMDQIQQALDAQLQIELTKFKLRVDIQLDLSEAQRDFNEFKRNVIDKLDDEDIFGNAKANFIDLTSYYKEGLDVIDALTDQLNGTLKELAIIDDGGYSPVYGTDRVKALEDLQNYMESLMDNLSDIQQLVGDIKESIFDMIDAADEAMEKQLDGYDYIADLIDHDMNLINLYYGDDAYKEMQKYYDRQNKNDKERLDFLRQQNNMWYQRMVSEQQAMAAIEDKSSQAYKDAEKRFEAYKEQWEDGIEELNDSLQNTLQNIIDKYTNAINIIFQNLDKSISNGRGFETINEEWELIGDYSDKYLDKINSMYEIQKLQNAYQEAINNNATNLSAQASLNEMMQEQLKYLRDKQRLSQYDVDRANALLQVETKRLALEQARNSKTRLRLRRDSQGNYTYQYTADENDVTQAEKDLADARNSLYNLTKDAYITNLDDMYSYYTDWQGRVKEIFEDTTLTVEERQEQLRTVTEGYSKLIDRLIKDNGELKAFLGEDAFSELTYYGNNPFQEITDFIPELNDYINEFGSGVQGMIDTIVDSGNFSAIAESLYAALEKEAAGFKEDIDELQINFNNLALGNDEIIDAEEGFLKNKEDLINLYGDELDAIEEVISAVEELMKTYNAAEKAAIDATTAAYNYQKTDMSTAAAASPNPVSRRPDATVQEQQAVQAAAAQQFQKVMEEYSSTTSSFDQISNKIKEDIADVAADAYVPAAAASPILSAQVSGADGQTPYVAVPTSALPQAAAAYSPDSSALVNQVVEALQSVKADVDLSNVLSTLGLNGVMIGGTIDQNVHVEVNFPNVTDHFEIEKAFENIVNMAAQYAYRD